MTHVVILVTSLEEGTGGKLKITGESRMSDDGFQVAWDVEVNYNDLVATINAAIKQAVVDGAAGLGYTIGALDKKTLIGAATGL